MQDARLRDMGVEPEGEVPAAVVEAAPDVPDQMAMDDSDQMETDDADPCLVISIVAEDSERNGVEFHQEVVMSISVLKKVVKEPVVTLMHAVVLAFEQNDQVYLHGGFGNDKVLEAAKGDADAVVPVVARFHKGDSTRAMKMGVVARTDVSSLASVCLGYTCRLTMVDSDTHSESLKYMIKGMTVETDPQDETKRSPKRKEREETAQDEGGEVTEHSCVPEPECLSAATGFECENQSTVRANVAVVREGGCRYGPRPTTSADQKSSVCHG